MKERIRFRIQVVVSFSMSNIDDFIQVWNVHYIIEDMSLDFLLYADDVIYEVNSQREVTHYLILVVKKSKCNRVNQEDQLKYSSVGGNNRTFVFVFYLPVRFCYAIA